MSDAMKKFWLNKITLRVVYIIAAQGVAHSVAFLTLANVQSFLSNVFVNPALKPDAPSFLEPRISAFLMVIGEFVYRWIHTKFILPHVTDKVSIQKPISTSSTSVVTK